MTSAVEGRLAGKVAIVTGAGSGIGRAIAQRFCDEGASVVAADISGAEQETARELGPSAIDVHVDVSVEEDIRRMIQTAVDRFGRLDVLCSNASIDGDIAPLAEYDTATFERVISVNLVGAFLGIKHAIAAMSASGGGSIIVTSSASALRVMPLSGAYAASKAAQILLTRVAAIEAGPSGIRVNAICPGPTDTPLLQRLFTEHPELKDVGGAPPLGRIAEASEPAAAAAFLASDDAAFISGAVLTIDGGISA